ncbi:biotin--[acetyl-CoA-carboxylase] ligase [Riemerella columbina]|uniref:biotin--[acetyl-CoA-carboxylase] ligase n=1 Tax=Riemerella columbina TaxID=103810 RepID=UPI00266F985C|nr:biotin--[acetyl-CoA-carboxylase] ligase [Riemerella columbina]WKS95461.1 biotin--[acetyl-CoA-carboxylase] ligase [Riemerella columbina]
MPRLLHIPECSSTNDEIIHLLNPPLRQGEILALYTLRQKRGKGQYGNTWQSQEDQNIAMSFAVNPQTFSHNLSLINYYTAVILRDFIANLTDVQPDIKWPNDIILKHKKICGILLEQKHQHLIIGIGINVLQDDFQDITKAGSLYTQTQQKYNPHQLATAFFEFFSRCISETTSQEAILADFNKHLYKKGQVAVFEKNGIRQNGIIQQADENGYLWIQLENAPELQAFYHKEISLLY